jgi:hypothetical protein
VRREHVLECEGSQAVRGTGLYRTAVSDRSLCQVICALHRGLRVKKKKTDAGSKRKDADGEERRKGVTKGGTKGVTKGRRPTRTDKTLN